MQFTPLMPLQNPNKIDRLGSGRGLRESTCVGRPETRASPEYQATIRAKLRVRVDQDGDGTQGVFCSQ